MPGPADILRSTFERVSSRLDTPVVTAPDIADRLFHRIRINYLEAYQRLLLAEPESAVRQSLKELFLALRLAAETAYSNDEKED